jgi:hypothetical protein
MALRPALNSFLSYQLKNAVRSAIKIFIHGLPACMVCAAADRKAASCAKSSVRSMISAGC